MKRLMAKPREELVVDTLHQGLSHLHDWPAGRPKPHPLTDDTFKLEHTRVIQVLLSSLSSLVSICHSPLATGRAHMGQE